jgi:hypothetical protein
LSKPQPIAQISRELEPAFSLLNQFANNPRRVRIKVLRARQIEARNAMANLSGNPIDQEPGRLDAKHIGIENRQRESIQCRREEPLTVAKRPPIAPVFRENDDGPWAHTLAPSCAALSLEKRSGASGRFVLYDHANIIVIEAHLKRTGSKDDVGIRVNPRVLTASPGDAKRCPQVVFELLTESPLLPLQPPWIIATALPKCGEPARLLRITKVREPSVHDIKIVSEAKQLPPKEVGRVDITGA